MYFVILFMTSNNFPPSDNRRRRRSMSMSTENVFHHFSIDLIYADTCLSTRVTRQTRDNMLMLLSGPGHKISHSDQGCWMESE